MYANDASNFVSIGARSNDDFRLFANAVDVMTLQVGGNVGIGTTNPAYTLDVNGNARIMSTNKLYFNDTSQYIYSPDAADLFIGSGDDIFLESSFIRFYQTGGGGTEHARISSATSWILGKTGIGTNSAQRLLHVYSGSAGADPSWSQADVALFESSTDNVLQLFSPTANGGYYAFSEPGTRALSYIGMYGSTNATAWKTAGMSFYVNSGFRMIIDSAGLVGIGTTDPDSQLHIQNDQNAPTELKVENATAGNAAQSRLYLIANSGGVVFSKYDDGYSDANFADKAVLFSTVAGHGDIKINTRGYGDLEFAVQGDTTEHIMTSGGKIGIGTAIPGTVGSAKLELYGAASVVTGPHIQVVTSTDAYPVFQQLN